MRSQWNDYGRNILNNRFVCSDSIKFNFYWDSTETYCGILLKHFPTRVL